MSWVGDARRGHMGIFLLFKKATTQRPHSKKGGIWLEPTCVWIASESETEVLELVLGKEQKGPRVI